MNFFSNKLQSKNYRKILKNYNKNLSKDFILRNWGTLSGDKSFYRTLKLFQLISKTQKIKGDIVEFGVGSYKVSHFNLLKKAIPKLLLEFCFLCYSS